MNQITFDTPPLMEAICMFKFGGDPCPEELIDEFYKSIASEYSIRQERKDETPKNRKGDEGAPFRFRNPESTRSVRFTTETNVLSVHQHEPYGGWPVFKAEIQSVFSKYIATVRPESIQSPALVYTNRLIMPRENVHYDEFLNVYPVLPKGKRDMWWINWSQDVTIMREEINSLLHIHAKPGRKEPDESDDESVGENLVWLNLIVIGGVKNPLTPETVPEWLEMAHEEIEGVFFDSLTEMSKETLGYKEVTNDTQI